MRSLHITRWVSALALLFLPMTISALPSTHFASKSKLALGHWVKIAVSQTGVHQITREQLQQMGFNDPTKVQVYGYGGEPLSEVLTESLTDDLQQVPVLHRRDKICFYASGPVNMMLEAQPQPHYSHTRNTYSLKAYYFLTDNAYTSNLAPQSHSYTSPATPRLIDTSLDALLHEQERISVAFTGSELLGEDLMRPNHRLHFSLINPSDTRLGVTSRVAAKVVRRTQTSKAIVSGNFSCQLGVGNDSFIVPYTSSATSISGCTSDYIYYQLNSNPNQNVAWVELPDTCHTGWLHYGFTVKPSESEAVLQHNYLDYFIITYSHFNRLSGHNGAQCMMGLLSSTADDVVRVEGGSGLQVWDVTTAIRPVLMTTRSVDNHIQFTPGIVLTPRLYVAFNPSDTLYEIDSYELLENQNLHGLATPDMLIITHHEFKAQAERLAEMHRQQDGMDVLVIDQSQAFNEFSSGTPSAMAIRLLCKMFYDRDSTKFKNLLIFGNQSFDNRGLVTGKQNLVVSYVASSSNNEDNSYINDDFFGYLADNSGQRISADKLCIGIGHMPVANTTEATQAVDKLEEYVYSTDYGPWRNNYSLWAENSTFKSEGLLTKVRAPGDTIKIYQLHESQAAGIGYIIDNDAKTQMVRDMAFVRMFPQSIVESYRAEEKRTSTEGKRHIKEMFSEGQYFATYVGHAGASSMSATGIWTSNDVLNTPYSHLPIMTTACCDVARYDSDSRGICELMFHKRDGGAIALFTTTRQVLATLNDDLNRAFTRQMFSYNKTGKMPRLGDCYKAAKNYYSSANTNKLHWVLLGDPALKVNYPKPLFNITAINGISVSTGQSIGASPLQRITVEARVMEENDQSQVNTRFNGDATITVYDSERICLSYIKGTGSHARDTMELNYPRERLLQVNGRVVNGVFHGTAVMPRYFRTSTEPLLLTVYAHEDGTDQMVNGMYDRLNKNNVSSSAVVDHDSPVIQAMYLNNEQEFAANATIGTAATLYIRATDNTSFNTQQLAMGRNMRITLDGGKTSYNLAKNLATVSDEGRLLNIAMPLTGLTPGRHTLDFTVSDVCGNATTQSITFVVSSQNDLTLQASDIAGSDKVEIDLRTFNLNTPPEVHIKVTDIHGNLVWNTITRNFPCTWDLTDMQGKRVNNGLYHIYGNFRNNEGYGGSNQIKYVVLPAANR